MFSLARRRRSVAASVAAALIAALLVGVPTSGAVADTDVGFLVESGQYPDGASVGKQNDLVLKDGNGGLQLVPCAAGTGQVEVERTRGGKIAKLCFETVFRPASLNLEITSSFGVKAGATPLDVTYSLAGEKPQTDRLPAGARRSVDDKISGRSTVVAIEVPADPAVDVPANAEAYPRTAIVKVRTGVGSCSGALIDRSWVLTAASCFATDPSKVASGAPENPARVLFGPDAANDKVTSGEGDLGVAVTYVESAGDGRDAALAKLKTPVDDISVLPLSSTEPVVGQQVAFTGFGRTPSVWVPLTSRKIIFPIADVDSTVLTALTEGASLCLGDGGAPGIQGIDGTDTLVAVASRSNQAGCFGSGVPAGNASVTSVRADVIAGWVAATVQKGRDTTPVSEADQALAQKIVASGKVSGTEALAQIQAYANGFKRGQVVEGKIRDCTIDSVLLKALKIVIVDQDFSVTISSLNEYCTARGSTAKDYHSRDGGGHAVDISVVNGVAATGDSDEDHALAKAMLAALPAPAGIGQLACRSALEVPSGWTQTNEDCSHNHFEYHGKQTAPAKPSFDIGGDGKADVLGITAGNELNLYHGNGKGGWAATSTASSGWASAKVIVHGDYNGDGKGDLIAVNSDGTLWFYEGDGAGGFPSKSLVARGWDKMSLITGGVDFNGDKRADLVAREADGNLYAYPGIGNGTFGSRIKIGSGWGSISKVLAGDFTGDGKGDILATNAAGLLLLYPGTGSSLTAGSQVGRGWGDMKAITGGVDYNGDGKADLYGLAVDGGLYFYPNTGGGAFNGSTRVGQGWTSLRMFS